MIIVIYVFTVLIMKGGLETIIQDEKGHTSRNPLLQILAAVQKQVRDINEAWAHAAFSNNIIGNKLTGHAISAH